MGRRIQKFRKWNNHANARWRDPFDQNNARRRPALSCLLQTKHPPAAGEEIAQCGKGPQFNAGRARLCRAVELIPRVRIAPRSQQSIMHFPLCQTDCPAEEQTVRTQLSAYRQICKHLVPGLPDHILHSAARQSLALPRQKPLHHRPKAPDDFLQTTGDLT